MNCCANAWSVDLVPASVLSGEGTMTRTLALYMLMALGSALIGAGYAVYGG